MAGGFDELAGSACCPSGIPAGMLSLSSPSGGIAALNPRLMAVSPNGDKNGLFSARNLGGACNTRVPKRGPLYRLGLLAILLTAPVASNAQLPTARLDAVFPPGMKAGTETEISLTGQSLEGADRLLFSDPGLSAVHGEALKFKVTASTGIAPGLYEMRVGGRYGISASRLFAVGSLPEVSEPDTNSTLEKAFAVTPPATINGTAGADAADFFRFTAAAGQRFSLSCAAQRIDSPLNAVLTILDSAGRELAFAHRTQGNDAALEFTAPAAGDFFVKVHDIVWQAGPANVYRLTINATADAASAVIPTVSSAGAVAEIKQPVKSETITKPATSAAEAHKVNLNSIQSCPASNQDWVEFTGEKDRKVVVEIMSHRNGEPTDWIMQVTKITRTPDGQEKSERVAEFDDTAGAPGAEAMQLGSRDPSGTIACTDGSIYRLRLTDRFKANRPWQLVLRDPLPRFSVVAFSTSPATAAAAVHRWSPFLRKGGSAFVQVAVLRQDGFDGPVTLHVEGLPEGVTTTDVTLPPNISTAALILRAAPDAKPWSGRIKLTGTSGDKVESATEAVPRWTTGTGGNDRADIRMSKDGLVLAVTDAEVAPLSIEPAEQKVYETSLAGSIEVPVKFTRAPTNKGFKGEWQSSLMGLPGLKQAAIVKPAADAAEAKLVLDLKRKDGNAFTPGTYVFHATARGVVKWQPEDKAPVQELTDAVYSAPIQIKIAASPVLLTAPASVTLAPGAKLELPLKLERRYGFAEAVTLDFAAPAGIKGLTAAKLTVPKEAVEVKLIIEAAADAPAGIHACKLNANCTFNGEAIPWTIELNVEVKP